MTLSTESSNQDQSTKLKRLVVAVPVMLYVEIDPQDVGFYDAQGSDAANELLRSLTKKCNEQSDLLDYSVGPAAHPVWVTSDGQYEEGDALGETQPYAPELS